MGVHTDAPTKTHTMDGTVTSFTKKIATVSRGDTDIAAKGRNRRGGEYKLRRFLLHSLSQAETVGGVEAYNRLKTNKQTDSKFKFQDGISPHHPERLGEGDVGELDRPHRCILPRSNQQEVQEVPPVRHRRKGVPVSCTSLRTGDSTPGVYYDYAGGGQSITGERSVHPSVPGRLVGEKRGSGISLVTSEGHSGVTRDVGTLSKLAEIGTGTTTGVRVCGSTVRLEPRESVPSREESGKDSSIGEKVQGGKRITSGSVVGIDRTAGIRYRPSTTGETTSETVTMALEKPLDHGNTVQGNNGGSIRSDKGRTPVVDEDHCTGRGGTFGAVPSTGDGFHGRIVDWMGSPLRGRGNFRSVVRSRRTHKCARDESNVSGPETFRRKFAGKENSDCDRQHDGAISHQLSGRDEIPESDARDRDIVSGGRQTQHLPESSAYSRKAKCGGGQVKPKKPDSTHGMVVTSGGVRRIVEDVVETTDRPVRDKGKQQTTIVREPGTGRLSVSCRRTVDELGESSSVCLSPDRTVGQSCGETEKACVSDDIGSPVLARETVVPRIDETASGASSTATTKKRPTQTTEEAGVSSKLGNAKSSRMESIKQAVEHKGFSEDVAEKVTKAICNSSSKVYETRWSYFVEWCQKKGIVPQKAEVQQVADFLLHLTNEKKLSISTVKGYRTAIAKVLLYSQGTDISANPVLSDLVSALEHDRLKISKKFPKWDLGLVLRSLTKEPYEPMATADMKTLTFKTLFLLWLASGARRGEMHALDVKKVVQVDNWKMVHLAPNPQFLAKNYNYKTGGRNFQGFQVEALKHRLGPDMQEDYLLCPVRALRYYLDRTKDVRKGSEQLFISWNKTEGKGVCKNTLASWVKNVILGAYKDTTLELPQASSHEIRALALSTAFYGNTSMDDIVTAGRWQSQTTFTSFYLRDMGQDLDGVYQLGPVVAGQQVVSRPS